MTELTPLEKKKCVAGRLGFKTDEAGIYISDNFKPWGTWQPEKSRDLIAMLLEKLSAIERREYDLAVFRVWKCDEKLKKKQPDHKMVSHNKHKIYLWAEKKRGKERTVHACFHGKRAVVFSQDLTQLMGALDVLDRKSKSLSRKSALAASPTSGTVFLAKAVDLGKMKTPFRSPLVKQVKSLAITAGEKSGNIFWRGQLVVKSPETAGQIKAIVDGFRALIQLRHGSDEDAKKLIDGFKVSAKKGTVTVEMKASSKDVLKMIEKAKKKHQDRKKDRKKGRHKKWSKSKKRHK